MFMQQCPNYVKEKIPLSKLCPCLTIVTHVLFSSLISSDNKIFILFIGKNIYFREKTVFS